MKRLTLFTLLTMLLAGAFALGGCTDTTQEESPLEEDVTQATPEMPTPTTPEIQAVAEITPTEGNDVSGTVNFSPADGGVHVTADLQGLPEGQHGFHVHQNGDCSNNAEAAGGHFNPGDDPHGAPTDPPGEHHRGDMGNIVADTSGMAHLDTTFAFLSLQSDISIVGKAVVVHGGADDLTSQPSGAAGPRVGCGVIEMDGGMADTTGGMMNDSM